MQSPIYLARNGAILALCSAAFLIDATAILASTWTPKEAMQIKNVTSVQVSPNGKQVVYSIRHSELNEQPSAYVSELYLCNSDGSDTWCIRTPWPASLEDPQWSPDGKWLAFIATRGGPRILFIRAGGGDAAADVIPVSERGMSVMSYKWSPQSDRICYTTLTRRSDTGAGLTDSVGLSKLYLVSSATATDRIARDCTPSKFSVSGEKHSGYDWSPDARHIVLSGASSAEANDWPTARLAICHPVSNDAVRQFKDAQRAEYSPLWSPDGRWIAYVATDMPPSWAGTARIKVMPARGDGGHVLAETFDGWSPYSELIGWSADSKALYFAEIHGTVTRVGRLSIDGSPPVLLGQADGVATHIRLNARRTHFGFCWETLAKPPEAHISGVASFEPYAVSKVNADVPKHSVGPTEVITWKSRDGRPIEGLLTYPAGYRKGSRCPLIVNIHGGPQGVFRQTYIASPAQCPVAVLSGRGYAVLRPNPRGSSGYGKAFRYANYRDWGGADYQDIMLGVDHVAQMGVANERRMGITGWSYGGYMTAWSITQNRRFKAASVGAGMSNLVSQAGTTDVPDLARDYLGGEYWENIDIYQRRSPITYIRGVKTPTLIQHGERDQRVPLSQSRELYSALKRQGCPTRMVVLPRTRHQIEEPRVLLECMERNVEWFDTYLASAAALDAD